MQERRSENLNFTGVEMKPIQTFTVTSRLPEKLLNLENIARNLRWSWDSDSRDLFRRIDRGLWESCGRNPVLMLSKISQEKFDELAQDEGFISHYKIVSENLSNYLNNRKTWFNQKYGDEKKNRIAYFSAEFGITESVPIYSGGLGMLAGDHLKSASELGIPLVGVGLLYQKGYFRQYLNSDGWQQELYPENDFYNMPIILHKGADGNPVIISVEFPGRQIYARIWKALVGRIELILLDTNFEYNSQEDQDIVDELYGGDNEMRIKQEMILGIGGYRALNALGIKPDVCHLNEGHSAFLTVERIADIMKYNKLNFDEARLLSASGNVFTTHTPVEAGHDYFEAGLLEKYMGYHVSKLGIGFNDFIGFGRKHSSDHSEKFCMTILAARFSSFRNGVSKLHGEVTKKMWSGFWKNTPVSELPVSSITNGVHAQTWLSKDIALLYDRYLGPKWREEPGNQSVWSKVQDIPVIELWNAHRRRKERLVSFTRRRLKQQLINRGVPEAQLQIADEVLDPDMFTICFARRFATYKRADLLLRDEKRLINILTNPERPVQIVFAGKAHPKDTMGKELIRKIIHFSMNPIIRSHVVFIEDYGMDIAKYLVSGADIWLNTPLRQMEASGTSGMKAAFNGAINVSIMDGWWDEGYNASLGWSIGRGELYNDNEIQNEIESKALYDLLETEILPEFYKRGPDRIPRLWVERMKNSLASLCPVFNTNRMVREYTEKYYANAIKNHDSLNVPGFSELKKLNSAIKSFAQHQDEIKILKTNADYDDSTFVGGSIRINSEISFGKLDPDDFTVEVVWGPLDQKEHFHVIKSVEMKRNKKQNGNIQKFDSGDIELLSSGKHGYTIRVYLKMNGFEVLRDPDCVIWAS